MIFQIYRNEEDRKYHEPSIVPFQNKSVWSALYGDTATYIDILQKAKKEKAEMVGIYQARRYLSQASMPITENGITAKNKIYHTAYIIRGNNDGLFYNSHPTIRLALRELLEKLCEKQPEYRNTCTLFLNSNVLYPHNMFIMPTKKFEEYSKWLQETLNLIKLPENCGLDKPYSLLAERLFTVWVMHNFAQKDQILTEATALHKVYGHKINVIDGVAD